jgi:hypothetical protein
MESEVSVTNFSQDTHLCLKAMELWQRSPVLNDILRLLTKNPFRNLHWHTAEGNISGRIRPER